ncbi:methionyl-tRNA formyltransferase Fmt1 [Schizosaccharomyces octosporus yFS286]|uniref:Methionyl-tRNA formyltransferase Fmt1 n=1 Tax=Schizosaccharomyces octosporus (strain yFS286) TaxID=483514 RepID=S9RAU1_SCHOY|nr:methionyl-tRNA formyltransferase Fmt1 [Schizosaccharomyces octosporus yFS286]EPX75255.1 methionyl-tRNA formyltransferase Fmt1 [Schizosaccharomyces octosporus yFS286]
MPSKLPLNIVFFGTDEFSIPILHKLASCAQRIHMVSAGGKRPRGRDPISLPSAAKEAKKIGIECVVLKKGWDGFQLKPDDHLAVSASFGRFIPESILGRLVYGGINIHPSFLPKYRGASPIYSTILKDDTQAGVTIQRMDTREFDKGKALAQGVLSLHGDEHYNNLRDKLAKGASSMLDSVLQQALYKRSNPNPELEPTIYGILTDTGEFQRSESALPIPAASWAGKISPESARINWESMTSRQIYNITRAFEHAWTTINGKKVFLYNLMPLQQWLSQFRVDVSNDINDWKQMQPGQFFLFKKNLFIIKTLDSAIVVMGGVQRQTGSLVPAIEWVRTFNSGKGGVFTTGL